MNFQIQYIRFLYVRMHVFFISKLIRNERLLRQMINESNEVLYIFQQRADSPLTSHNSSKQVNIIIRLITENMYSLFFLYPSAVNEQGLQIFDCEFFLQKNIPEKTKESKQETRK